MEKRFKPAGAAKDFFTARFSPDSATPFYGVPGILKDSYLLSVEKPAIPGKGNLYAFKPLYWDTIYNIIDFDDTGDSSLYININLAKGNAVKLTFNLIVFNYSRKNGTGKLNVTFNSYSTARQLKSISLPFSTNVFTSFSAQCNKITDTDAITVKIDSKEFADWAFRDVKIEIFEPFL